MTATLPERTTTPPLPDDWHIHTKTTDEGHLLWTGCYHNGVGALFVNCIRYSVPSLVYAKDRNREPEGVVTTTCRVPGCILANHLADFQDRQTTYLATAEANGRPGTEGHCPQGHPWANAVFSTDGRRRCWACHKGEPPVINDLAVEFALAGCTEDLSRTDQLEVVRRAVCVRGLTHKEAAVLAGCTARTVARWCREFGWKKPKSR